MPNVGLKVNGREFSGWKSARVSRGIESIAGSFDLSVSERWAEDGEAWPIGEEDECSLEIDGVKVITGYVDKRALAYGPSEHSLSVSGRDRTGDLVDCSAVLKKWEFSRIPLNTLAAKVAEPFGIPVSVQSGLVLPKASEKLTVDPGDSAFEVIEKACRMAGVLPVSDGQGGLLLTRAGSARASTALVEGKNILSASAEYDASSRFRRYIVRGQHKGSDEFFGANTAAVTASADDENVRRSVRTLIVRPEGNVTAEHAKRRAQWEAIVRAARADSVSVVVQGWQQGNGELWPINALVKVESPRIGVSGEMLITQVTYSLDEGGSLTTLNLKRPDAFIPQPVVSKAKAAQWKELAGGA